MSYIFAKLHKMMLLCNIIDFIRYVRIFIGMYVVKSYDNLLNMEIYTKFIFVMYFELIYDSGVKKLIYNLLYFISRIIQRI